MFTSVPPTAIIKLETLDVLQMRLLIEINKHTLLFAAFPIQSILFQYDWSDSDYPLSSRSSVKVNLCHSLYIWKVRGCSEHVIFALTFHWFCSLHAPNGQSAAVPLIFIPYTFVIVCSELTHTIQIQCVTTQQEPGFEMYQVACTLFSWQFRTLFLDSMNIAVVMFCPRHCQSK